MATQNSINKKSQDFTLDSSTAEDSFVQFDINGTGEFRIGVDDTDDSFRVSQGSALGTNDTFVMTAAGERTMPLQPAFLAVLNSTLSNVTGNDTYYTIVWDTEIFDQNGDFDGTSTFTAPVTGRYVFNIGVKLGDVTVSNTYASIYLTATGGTYLYVLKNPASIDSNNEIGLSLTIVTDMDAADTASAGVVVADSGEPKITDLVSSGSADPHNWFSGYLAC